MSSKDIVKAIGNAFLLMTLVDYWCDKDKIDSDSYDVFDPNNTQEQQDYFPYY